MKLKVYGDWFSSDTRATYSILKHSEVDFDFNLIDTLSNKQFEKSFTDISPGGHIPAFKKNGQKVICQGKLLFEWLVKIECQAQTFEPVEKETKAHLKAMADYFFKETRSATSQLVLRIAHPKLHPEKAEELKKP